MRRPRDDPRGARPGGAIVDRLAAAQRAWAGADQAGAALFAFAVLLEVTAALAGGASQGDALSLMAVELASLPLLFGALWLVLAGAAPREAAAPLLLLAAVVATPLLQLLPLPPDLWTRLPGRGPALRILETVGLGRPALPFSLAPEATWRMAMGLAPPAAMFIGALFLTERQRRLMAALWLVLGAASLGLGALQMLGGPESPLYLYQITNAGSPVGFFANRNHQAALLLALMPVAASFAAAGRGELRGPRGLGVLLCGLYVVVAIAGLAATRSRAGVLLAGLALAGVAAVIARGGQRRRWPAALGIGIGAAGAVAAVAMLAAGPILARFGEGGEPRFAGWPLVAGAAARFLPLGSGLGSFGVVYGQLEPLDQVSPLYFNHAHNDYLELWLEAGLVAAALMLAFAVWLGTRLWAIWRARTTATDLPAAASLLILLLLAHSAVDYPLRTEALAVLFAFACAEIAGGRSAEPARRGRRVRP